MWGDYFLKWFPLFFDFFTAFLFLAGGALLWLNLRPRDHVLVRFERPSDQVLMQSSPNEVADFKWPELVDERAARQSKNDAASSPEESSYAARVAAAMAKMRDF
jgi:hypothetical protein